MSMDFLTVHPRTKLWWEQRDTCRDCKYLIFKPGRPEMRCANGARNTGLPHGPDHLSCITMRDEGSPCGPEAKLFEERMVRYADKPTTRQW